MSTAVAEVMGRFCKEHDLELREHGSALICPRGHAVGRFKVVNKRSGRVVHDDVPNDEGVTPVRQAKPVAVSPPAKAEPVPKSPNRVGRPNKPEAEKERTYLRAARFVHDGMVLYLRLQRVRLVGGQHSWRVLWEAYSEAGGVTAKEGREHGTSAVEETEGRALKAFDAQVSHAMAEGWEHRRAEARKIRITPIPSARKRA